VPGSPRREPREYGSVSGGATRIPSACASGFQAIQQAETGRQRRARRGAVHDGRGTARQKARRSVTAATEGTTEAGRRSTTGDRARRSETADPTRAMPGAGKPEARAEGIRVGVRWSNAYSLSLRFGLPSNPAGGNGQTTQSTTGCRARRAGDGATKGTTVRNRRYNETRHERHPPARDAARSDA
jgi:hypothetical protein